MKGVHVEELEGTGNAEVGGAGDDKSCGDASMTAMIGRQATGVMDQLAPAL